MELYTPLAAGFTLALAGVHLFADRLHHGDGIPRSAWLSAAGGITVAYVFVHLLPEVEAAGRAIRDSGGPVMARFERHAYLIALAGFLTFYGVERSVTAHRTGDTRQTESDAVFWVHVAAFAAYNLLIGYLLHNRDDPGVLDLVLYGVAMGTHFLVNDFALKEHHGEVYRNRGRWVLAGAVVVGGAIGLVTTLSELLVAYLLAFLAGSIVLNVIKEELPSDRESRFWAFAVGAAGYATLLLFV